ncbi:MAG: hypothetical protein H0T44_05955 [Gemmatimonadales bacterium]|nr:hypothetical protein [Gemmatimonadales bacterium]MDQ3426609.1 hypothetical protein [Gemmatimonadota bacterium]
MADRLTVTYQGKEFDAVQKSGQEAGSGPGKVWEVTRDGAPITSFPADGADDREAIKEKVLAWLAANEGRPAADVGRQ